MCLAWQAPACAQEEFEVRVEQYERLGRGSFEFEPHFTYIGEGDRSSNGPVAPPHHQAHFTFELTGGITEHISLGLMTLTAVRPKGGGMEFAGWRLIPHFYVPESWVPGVKLALTAEISFPAETYHESSRALELKPTIEKQFSRFLFDLNPSVERSLSMPDRWNLEPSLRVSHRTGRLFQPSLEYYGSLREGTHQLYSGGDLDLAPNLRWHFGVGFGLTSVGSRVVYKTRLEYEFGRKQPD
jgi:hypothetical protein